MALITLNIIKGYMAYCSRSISQKLGKLSVFLPSIFKKKQDF
jgi:hypothetical protein